MKWRKRTVHKLMFWGVCMWLSIGFTATAQKKHRNSLLWEISGNGLQQPSYLYGTIHLICKEDFMLSETLRQKFNASSKIYLELDMDDPQLQMSMMQQMQLPKGQTLQSLFGEANFNKADSIMRKEMNLSLAAFNNFKPLMILSLLTQRMLPCNVPESYELTFVKMAREQQKEVLGLETLADQMAVFDAIPDSLEVKNLMDMLHHFEKHRKNFSELIGFYKAGNLQKLYFATTQSPDLLGSKEILLDRRNRNWIPVMEKAMQQHATFFAVGAAHLAGNTGVIELLREKGYKVKTVKQ